MKSAISAAESKNGVRYSVLLSLDPISYTAIHKMFLGTGRRMFDLWINLSKEDIEELESRIALFKALAGVGRLPGHIGSRHGGFTATQ